MSVHKNFQNCIRFLRKSFPPPYPVRVSSRPILKNNGGTRLLKMSDGSKVFVLVIDDTLLSQLKGVYAKSCEDYCLYCNLKNMILCHEWAHLLSWDETKDSQDDHCPQFGKAYAKVWRAYEKWCDN